MTPEYLNIALVLAKNGWKLFPSIYTNGQHTPLIKWSEGATASPDIIREWASKYPSCYFCVATKQSNITILDIDNKKGKNGSKNLFDLTLKYGDLPTTLVSCTPSGGYHYYFYGVTAISVGKLAEGIDTPVMVPIPGTCIPGKGDYRIFTRSHLAAVPSWVQSVVGESAPKELRKDDIDVELDTVLGIDQAIKYLKERSNPAIQGQGGDRCTYETACIVRDYGISEDKCLELMLDHWNDRCDPPWGVEELNKKIKNAYEYAQANIGKNTAQFDFSSSSHADSGSSTPSGTLLRLSSLKGVPPPRKWIIEGILPACEVTALYGDGGLGKSLLSLQLALSIAGGGKFIKMPVIQDMPVLYIAGEDTKDEIHRRIHSILSAPEYCFMDFSTPLFVSPRVGEESILAYQDGNRIVKGPFYDPLIKMVSEVKNKHGVLVITDTVSDIFSVNENDRVAASYCIKTVLGSLIKHHGCTILIVAHPSKNSKRSGMFDSGSSGWRNSIRNMLVLSSHENENLKDHRTFHQTKCNYSAKIEPTTLKWSQGRFINEDEKDIIDDIWDENIRIMYEFIKQQCEKVPPKPLGLHHLSTPNIYKIDVTSAAGELMSKELKDRIVNKLMLDGLIHEIKGKPRGNGLWPTKVEGEG